MLREDAIQIIRDFQDTAIEAKALVEGQLKLIYDNNWFNIWVPRALHGAELPLPEGLTLLEELAYWDGGLGWTVTLCAGANMFAGYLNKELAQDVFSNTKVCLGGSGRASGKAVWDGANYTISGFWRFATGAPHLSHFTLNSYVYDGERQRYDEDGEAVVFSFLIPRDQVLIHYDWDSFGLACTASHSFSLDNVAVDQRHAFRIQPDFRITDSALYRIPFVPFAELTLLVNYMGMYRRFLDLVEKHFFEKSRNEEWLIAYGKRYFKRLDEATTALENDRQLVKELSITLWNHSVCCKGDRDELLLSNISQQAKRIVKSIREEVISQFPLVGIDGAQNGNELNTVFKNIFTATQHSLLNIYKD